MYGLAVESKQLLSLSMVAGLLSLSGLLATSACGASTGGGNGPSINRGALTSDQTAQHATLVRDGAALWAQRGEAGKAMAAINKWEAAIKVKPADSDTCAKLSRAYHFAAGGWLSLREPSVRVQLHQRGFAVAELGLKAVSPRFEQLRSQGSKIENAIEVIERKGIPLAYWYAANLGAYAYASGMLQGLKHKGRVEKLISHVYKTERSYFEYGADRFLAGFYAAAPAFIGGNVTKAGEHFEHVAKNAPNNLSAHFLKARFFSVRTKDKALFDSLVKGIVEAKLCATTPATTPCIAAGFEPEAALEKAKARKLMTEKSTLFN